MGDGRFNTGFYEGQTLSGGGPLRDGIVKDVLAFGLDDVHG